MRRFSTILVCLFFVINIHSQDVSHLIPQIKDAVVTVYAQNENGDVFASGSGFFITSDGMCVTNFHVLQGASKGKIKCTNGKEYKIGKIVDYNPKFDLVKFRVQSDKSVVFHYLKQQFELPDQGSFIVNYSNPLGAFENSVSTGIIAAIRDYTDYEKVLQITAPISHGSSGSPIMNNKGEVVGVATFCAESGQSLNFAVSVLQLQKLKRNLQVSLSDMRENELETPLLKKANALAAMGNYDEALPLFTQEIDKNNSHLAYFYRGLWGCRYRRFNIGVQDLLQACEMDTTNYTYADKAAEYLKNLIIESYDMGKPIPPRVYILASELYRRCIRIDPDRPDAYAGMGYLMLYIGMITEEESAYRIGLYQLDMAIILCPTATYHMYRAQIYSKMKNYGKCILDCNQAIALDPMFFRAYLMRGTIRAVRLRQVNDGILDLTIAIDLAEDDEEKSNAYTEMATAYYCKYIYGIERSYNVLNTALDYARKGYALYPNPVTQSVIDDIERAKQGYY